MHFNNSWPRYYPHLPYHESVVFAGKTLRRRSFLIYELERELKIAWKDAGYLGFSATEFSTFGELLHWDSSLALVHLFVKQVALI